MVCEDIVIIKIYLNSTHVVVVSHQISTIITKAYVEYKIYLRFVNAYNIILRKNDTTYQFTGDKLSSVTSFLLILN